MILYPSGSTAMKCAMQSTAEARPLMPGLSKMQSCRRMLVSFKLSRKAREKLLLSLMITFSLLQITSRGRGDRTTFLMSSKQGLLTSWVSCVHSMLTILCQPCFSTLFSEYCFVDSIPSKSRGGGSETCNLVSWKSCSFLPIKGLALFLFFNPQ